MYEVYKYAARKALCEFIDADDYIGSEEIAKADSVFNDYLESLGLEKDLEEELADNVYSLVAEYSNIYFINGFIRALEVVSYKKEKAPSDIAVSQRGIV